MGTSVLRPSPSVTAQELFPGHDHVPGPARQLQLHPDWLLWLPGVQPALHAPLLTNFMSQQ